MKKILFSFLFVGAAAIAANAQQHEGKHEMKKRHHHKMMMAQKLNFSEEQKTKLKTIHEDFRKQMQVLEKQDQLTVKEWKSRKQALRKEHKAKLESVLTKEQKDQLARMKEERQAKRKQMAEKKLKVMKQHLGLTEKQTTQIKDLHAGLRLKIESIRQNESVDKAAKREQIQALVKENHEKMKSILTEEQLKKMKEMKQRHGKSKMV